MPPKTGALPRRYRERYMYVRVYRSYQGRTRYIVGYDTAEEAQEEKVEQVLIEGYLDRPVENLDDCLKVLTWVVKNVWEKYVRDGRFD